MSGSQILILGIGNLLWADEGFGVRAVETLAAEWALPDSVIPLDGGTQGLYLLPFVEEADALIVFDAVDYGLKPGTLKVVRDGEVPAFLGAKKMSLHQTGFQEVIATAMLRDLAPSRMTLIGVQPVELEDFGGGLREETAARIPAAVEIAVQELRERFGVALGRRDAPALEDATPLSRTEYEGGRPSEAEACRVGDDRFLSTGA